MERDKIFMGVAAIVLLAIIGFNFDGITGNASLNLVPDITIYPKDITAGEIISIKVKPNSACVDPEISLYFSGVNSDSSVTSSGGRKATVTQKGGFSICKNSKQILDPDGTFTVTYQTRPDWDGQYYAKIFYWKDKKTQDSINGYFNVESSKK